MENFKISVCKTTPKKLDEEDSNFHYLVTKNGFFLRKKNPFFMAQVPVSTCSILEELHKEAKWCGPKLSKKEFGQIVWFFATVYEKKKAEAVAFIYSDGKRYKFNIPKQIVSGASVQFIGAPPARIGEFLRIGTIHSHGNMCVGPSAVDVEDEKYFDGLHMIVEKLSLIFEGKVMVDASLVINGNRIPIDANEVVDIEEDQDLPNKSFFKNKTFKLPLLEIEEVVVSEEMEKWLNHVYVIKPKPINKIAVKVPHYNKPRKIVKTTSFEPIQSADNKIDPCSKCPFNKKDIINIEHEDNLPVIDLKFGDSVWTF